MRSYPENVSVFLCGFLGKTLGSMWFPLSSSYHIIRSEDEIQCFIFRSALSNHIQWHQYLEEIWKHKISAFQSRVIWTKEKSILGKMMSPEIRECGKVWSGPQTGTAQGNCGVWVRVWVWGTGRAGQWVHMTVGDINYSCRNAAIARGKDVQTTKTKPIKMVTLFCTAFSTGHGFKNWTSTSWWSPPLRNWPAPLLTMV